MTTRNESGIEPMEYKVLVLPEADDGTITTPSGFKLYKPDETRERDQNAANEGCLIAHSPVAFQFETGAPKAEVGQTVIFAKYAGHMIKGRDGKDYRLMNDKDIIGVRADD